MYIPRPLAFQFVSEISSLISFKMRAVGFIVASFDVEEIAMTKQSL